MNFFLKFQDFERDFFKINYFLSRKQLTRSYSDQ